MGQLEKLTISAFSDPKTYQASEPEKVFEAMFNPESFTVKTQINYCTEEAPGSTSSPAKFRNIEPRTFDIELLLDGTGAAGKKEDIVNLIEEFKKTIGYYGTLHRPAFLQVQWGTFIIACVLVSYSINYKLFKPDGTPLRATISTSFKEFRPKSLENIINNKSSPDLSHSRLVIEGDRLFLYAQDEYRDPKYVVQLAEFNQLDTIRYIKSGDRIEIPPLK